MSEPAVGSEPDVLHGFSPPYCGEPWFDERYTNTRGEIAHDAAYITEAHCDVCHKRGVVLVADSSMDEYNSITICMDCIKLGRERFEANKS